ncbi:phytanoyl-CoA dioxygenase family protein [Iodobacter sp. CM08]|uniref:phytanoyl-CoA dioxygenase family protein n=1 Tax=Iodobacter sp. CM08 TaxID=3085902 RepID=UPI00298123F5|nr:phytanoyl-CoA dioxygenase family protein [Iodobacter sp. CM08]MDW5418016.1 phytanoyl-CoA dioxygenase family protein [Iodobacter sp. CM08]
MTLSAGVTVLLAQFCLPIDLASLSTRFKADGIVVLRGFVALERVNQIRKVAMDAVAQRIPPFELEAELGYPGAPTSTADIGGGTIRRLRNMAGRDPIFAEWAGDLELLTIISSLLDTPQITLTQVHHNSLMSKQPSFSSDTRWHRDVRYWCFSRPELVSAWLALGDETTENGGLGFVPGSHQVDFPSDAYDKNEFLMADHPKAASWVAQAQFPSLAAGDVVLFDARTFHAASRNRTAHTKYSLVYSYHASSNTPIADTRSSSQAGWVFELARTTATA